MGVDCFFKSVIKNYTFSVLPKFADPEVETIPTNTNPQRK